MKTPRITEIDGPPVVGQHYMVPCARTVQLTDGVPGTFDHACGAWTPVIGPRHTDREIIGFSFEHYHYDLRFLPLRLFNHLTWGGKSPQGAYGTVAFAKPTCTRLEGPIWRRRKCRREQPPYPVQYGSGPALRQHPWLGHLEDAFADRTLPTCKTCPHRGILLTSQPAVDGRVTCPGHGLTWDTVTGALIRTADQRTETRP